jgi:hypothetical protein
VVDGVEGVDGVGRVTWGGVVEVEEGVHEVDGVAWDDAVTETAVADGIDALVVKGNSAGGERKRTKRLEIERRRDGFVPRPAGENEEVPCIIVVRPYVDGRRRRGVYVAGGCEVGRCIVYEFVKVEVIIPVPGLVFRFVVFLRLLVTIPLLCLNSPALFAVSALAISLFLCLSPRLLIGGV